MSRWDYLKEKFADMITVIVAGGVVFLIGASVLLSFMGEYKIDKAVLEMRIELVERHNQSVMRESQMVQDLAELKREIAQLRLDLKTEQQRKNASVFSPTSPLAPVITFPFTTPAEIKNIPSPDPRQQASDWEKKHRETFILKK